MSSRPTISVLMPVYNSEKYLKDAIDSILKQTFPAFELIIINDGSTDRTDEIIKSYKDQRIVYVKNKENLGLSKSFNIGIKVSQGIYIARMDADDISLPDRFQRQIKFLKQHPEIDVLGSSVCLIDQDGNKLKVVSRPTNHIEIKWASLFSNPMYHPTIMTRVGVLKHNHFDEKLHNSEDYELWSRLLFKTETQFANLEESLLLYRVYPESFTQKLDEKKRIASAENTIRNIAQYTTLNELEKSHIIAVRQEKTLTVLDLLSLFITYLRVTTKFNGREQPPFFETISIYLRLSLFAFFLLKYAIKH